MLRARSRCVEVRRGWCSAAGHVGRSGGERPPHGAGHHLAADDLGRGQRGGDPDCVERILVRLHADVVLLSVATVQLGRRILLGNLRRDRPDVQADLGRRRPRRPGRGDGDERRRLGKRALERHGRRRARAATGQHCGADDQRDGKGGRGSRRSHRLLEVQPDHVRVPMAALQLVRRRVQAGRQQPVHLPSRQARRRLDDARGGQGGKHIRLQSGDLRSDGGRRLTFSSTREHVPADDQRYAAGRADVGRARRVVDECAHALRLPLVAMRFGR